MARRGTFSPPRVCATYMASRPIWGRTAPAWSSTRSFWAHDEATPMREQPQLRAEHLCDWRAGWGLGTFGAIAEFHHDEGEKPQVDDAAGLARARSRGGIRLNAAG